MGIDPLCVCVCHLRVFHCSRDSLVFHPSPCCEPFPGVAWPGASWGLSSVSARHLAQLLRAEEGVLTDQADAMIHGHISSQGISDPSGSERGGEGPELGHIPLRPALLGKSDECGQLGHQGLLHAWLAPLLSTGSQTCLESYSVSFFRRVKRVL